MRKGLLVASAEAGAVVAVLPEAVLLEAAVLPEAVVPEAVVLLAAVVNP